MQISITEWLDETAKKYPEKVAITDSKGFITFKEYREKALAISRQIIDLGLDGQQPIVIFMEKGLEALVAFLATAYSRDFYSPIDVDMPEIRINKILEILQPVAVITTAELKGKFERFDYDLTYIIYDEIFPQKDDISTVQPITRTILDSDLLYVLFTSGSTGIPKGVGIRHRSVIDYIDWVSDEFGIKSCDSFGNQAPFYFDNSILDIYTTIKTGAGLYIIPRELFSKTVELMEYIKKNEISTIFWVPTELIMVARIKALKKVDVSDTLKRVLFCGEVMPNKELNYWRDALPDIIYSNLYGPTEITDACSFYVVDREFSNDEPLPIGNQIPNTELFLLDNKNKLIKASEVGKIGEICVKGTCLAVGYYRNSEKTDAVFVQNPLNDRYEEKIYRTGDLASYNEYGELIYIGRKDYQIKHLGHRIELGEIETAVSSFESINRNCCLYDSKRSRIVLFFTSDAPDESVSRDVLRERLRKLLPAYMIPEKIVKINEMPINANGKIDRNMLGKMM